MQVADLVPIVVAELGVGAELVQPDARLGDLGMDSLGLLTLLLRIEADTGRTGVLEELPMVTTVQDLCDAISREEGRP